MKGVIIKESKSAIAKILEINSIKVGGWIYFQINQFYCFPRGQFLRQEFAPVGANSYLEEWTPFEELFLLERQIGISVFLLCKTDEKCKGM